MKPPPRSRRKPPRATEPNEPSAGAERPWKRAELRQLLAGLKKQAGLAAGGELDCGLLHQDLPTRSMSEIASEVEHLKNQVISNATYELSKKRLAERKSKNPSEEWTRMASALTGTQEETIHSAFHQMLSVLSGKPSNLKSCQTAQVGRPRRCTVPLPLKRILPAQGNHLNLVAIPGVVGTPSSVSVGPHQPTAPVIKVVNSPAVSTPRVLLTPLQSSAGFSCPPHNPQLKPPPSTPLRCLSFPSPHTFILKSPPASTSSGSSPLPGHRPLIGSSSVSPASGSISKEALKDSGAIVDFNKIYCFLSGIQKHTANHLLTPMESAIVLDLLMSLPEELLLLECNKLQKHLIQAHGFFSLRADSKETKEMYKHLKRAHCGQAESPSPPEPKIQNITDSEGENSRSAASNPLSPDPMTVPPLNPFMIPLALLKRREPTSCNQ